jgi:hypothetical protein
MLESYCRIMFIAGEACTTHPIRTTISITTDSLVLATLGKTVF